MKDISISYNPYLLETVLAVDGKTPEADSELKTVTAKGKRLQEWASELPGILCRTCQTKQFKVKFHGMALDFDDLNEAFDQAKNTGIIDEPVIEFIEAPNDVEVKNRISKVFSDLQNGPISDFRDTRLIQAFERLSDPKFPINVIATMSSGKSTLINSLLRRELMPAKNEACTAIITEILDNDNDSFSANVLYKNGDQRFIKDLTYEIMDKMNSDIEVDTIYAEGNIPFLDANGMALDLIDTPGPNNSRDESHKQRTYDAIGGGTNNLILYVLNGTQLSTNDDYSLLEYVSKQIKEGGKQARDRFLFVINKMDCFDPEKESIPKAIQNAKDYLAGFDIEDPQIFPCSAYLALNIRTALKDIDVKSITRAEERKLSAAARDSLNRMYTFIDNPDMHLEKYSTLTPSAKKALEARLKAAEDSEDDKEQALIHSGICSIEEAIKAYVKKYAVTKTVKDLVELLESQLTQKQVFEKTKQEITQNESYAKDFRERAEKIKAQIASGVSAKAFKEKVEALDPIPDIEEKARKALFETESKVAKFMNKLIGTKTVIESREETRKLMSEFAAFTSNVIPPLQTDISNIIENKLNAESRRLLDGYKEKLQQFDSEAGSNIDFNTEDLIKGNLALMEETVQRLSSSGYISETADIIGETETVNETYYVKTGEEEIDVFDHTEKVKVGTKRVKTGSHKEWAGTKRVLNPNKRWWKIFTPKYIEEDVYKNVDDYTEEDVFDDKAVYRKEKRDIMEERNRTYEKYSLNVAKLSRKLTSDFKEGVNAGIEDAIESAKEQTYALKDYFKKQFDILDKIIEEKYSKLVDADKNAAASEKALKEQQEILDWLEENMREIAEIISMKRKDGAA